MQRPVIEVKDLSKKYRLGVVGASRLRDELDLVWGRFRGRSRADPQDELWALRGVSFEVQPGEVVGIVGGNGAGKSTLLKILSRITRQTFGEVVLRGNVASLLEIGTGFHPDLTGRENVFLNGAILGMTRVEIKKKFDEIVAFAEIERFIDTPVKRYSSGMYVRLAFAVAAHLEPEILIVDEVLAVGDAEFQRKCIGKMQDVAAFQGRTILFVSHNMAAVTALCQRAAYLKNGKLITIGATGEVLSVYLQNGRGATYERIPDPGVTTSRSTWIRRAWIGSKVNEGVTQDALKVGEKFTLNVELCIVSGEPIELIASFHDQLRRPLWTSTEPVVIKDSISSEARVLIKQHYVLPRLTVPGLTIDLATADAAKYPFLDHVVGAITLSIAQPEGTDYKAQNTNYPFLVEPEQEVFVLEG